jgi:long-subunit acyl-CoA synthetase (AMP-forming)
MQIKRYKTFLGMLTDQEPNNTALIFSDGKFKKELTYSELIEKINNTKIKDKTCFGVFPDGSIDTLISIFALAKNHKQIVLLNPYDSEANLISQIEKSDVDYLIGNGPYLHELSTHLTKGLKENSDKILFFTSGTTSSNKAVVLTEQSLCASSYNGSALLPLKQEDLLLGLLPLNHVYGFVCSLLWAFNCGATVALSRGLTYMMDDFHYFNPTAVSLVPQQAIFLTSYQQVINPEIRLALVGGGVCPAVVLNAMKKRGVEVHFGYGLTETSSGVALSLGSNPLKMTICPDDVIKIAPDNEILISSSTCLMEGYYKEEKDTKKAITDGFFHSGDLGKIDKDGLLEIIGRKNDVLVLDDGTKIFCPEYEEALMKVLPGKDLAVGLREGKVVLYIGKSSPDSWVKDVVYDFNLHYQRSHQITDIVFTSKSLPRTQTGKVKRWALAKIRK